MQIESPTTIWCNNVVENFLIVNPIPHTRTKNVVVHYHFVCKQVATSRLEAKYVCSKEQLMDILTKPLSMELFHYLVSKLMKQLPD